LSQAGTVIELKDNHIGNDSYRFELGGAVTADLEAVNSATADLQGRFKGLETLIGLANTRAIEQPETAARYDQMLKQLELLQKFGAKQEGQDLYLYDFKVNAQGQMLLNGQDAKAVMGR